MKLSWEVVQARLRSPLVTAHGVLETRPLVRVRLHDEPSRLIGEGEAAPLESYDGVTVENVVAALEDCRTLVEGFAGDVLSEQLLEQCARVAVLPQAVSAIDLALWDLEGRRSRQPVWSMLGAAAARPVEVNHTVAAADRSGAAVAAAQARQAGFRCLKLKVGLGDDLGRVAAVRAAAGPGMDLRLDANGAWTPEQALATLGAMAPASIECCEEPCHGLEATAQVAAGTAVAVALDESARLPGALDQRLCQAVCLKLSSFGGISGLLEAARRARAVGYEVYLASAWDGPLGIAALLHAAAALAPDRPCGLATLDVFAGRRNPLPARQGRIVPPSGPGLGSGLVDWYRG